MNPKTPPHTYPPGFPAGIIKEYAMRYRILYRVRNGPPLAPGKRLDSYFRLGLLVKTETGLQLTPSAEALYFTPQVFE